MSGVRVGVIGAGQIATAMHIPVLHAMDGVTLAWIADADARLGNEVAALNRVPFVPVREGLNHLPECDVALIAIPVEPRRAYFDHYSGSGTAILAEKPLAITGAEHERIAARFAPWQLAVGYQRRFYATSLLARKLIERRIFGPLEAIQIFEGGRVMRTGGGGGYQDLPAERGGGIVRNLGCHSLDLALWLTRTSSYRIEHAAIEWDGATDRRAESRIVLSSADGSECQLDWEVSWLESMANVMELRFASAVLKVPISPADQIDLADRQGAVMARIATPPRAGATTSSQAFYLEWRDLLKAVADKRPPEPSAVSTLPVARLMDELLEA